MQVRVGEIAICGEMDRYGTPQEGGGYIGLRFVEREGSALVPADLLLLELDNAVNGAHRIVAAAGESLDKALDRLRAENDRMARAIAERERRIGELEARLEASERGETALLAEHCRLVEAGATISDRAARRTAELEREITRLRDELEGRDREIARQHRALERAAAEGARLAAEGRAAERQVSADIEELRGDLGRLEAEGADPVLAFHVQRQAGGRLAVVNAAWSGSTRTAADLLEEWQAIGLYALDFGADPAGAIQELLDLAQGPAAPRPARGIQPGELRRRILGEAEGEA